MPSNIGTLGYLAGLVDGEGYIGVIKVRAKDSICDGVSIVLTIANTDKAMIDWLAENIGGSVAECNMNRLPGHWKQRWDWHLYGENAVTALRACLPWLITKRRRAEIALEINDLKGQKRVPIETNVNGQFGGGFTLSPEVVERRAELLREIDLMNARTRTRKSELVSQA